jgi:hypothetical protein
MRAIPQRRLGFAILYLAIWGQLAACGTEPDDRLAQFLYAVGYEPPQVISTTEECDHLVTHVLLVLSEAGSFELSTNVQDDCTRTGGGFADGEVFRLGTYTRQGPTLSFTSDGAALPEFSGTLDTEAIVFLPGLDSLSSPVSLRVPLVETNPLSVKARAA